MQKPPPIRSLNHINDAPPCPFSLQKEQGGFVLFSPKMIAASFQAYNKTEALTIALRHCMMGVTEWKGVVLFMKKRTTKLSALMLSAVMLFALCIPAGAVEAEGEANDIAFAKNEVLLNGEHAAICSGETNLGDLVTDAILWQTKQLGKTVDIALLNGGRIHTSIPAGDLTKRQLQQALPTDSTLTLVTLTGAQLLEALESATASAPNASDSFPQLAGMILTVNTGAPFAGKGTYPNTTAQQPSAIQRVLIQTINGQAFSKTQTYHIVTDQQLAAGSDAYHSFASAAATESLGVSLSDAVVNYIATALKGTVSAAPYQEAGERLRTYSYRDVLATDWFAMAVNHVTFSGLMNGMEGAFAPNVHLNRAMMATTLYRMAGSPAVTASNPFSDVPQDAWYRSAVLWAFETGITNGTSDTTYSPMKSLTREELATFLYRFADYESLDPIVVEGDHLSAFTDAQQIFPYAKVSMNWAVQGGLLSGTTPTTLQPKQTATRAQVATILARYTADG